MMERAPYSPMAGTGWLIGWRLTFGSEDLGWEGALATVVKDPGSEVFVVIYDTTPEDEKLLDRWGAVSWWACTRSSSCGCALSRGPRWPGSTCSTLTRVACPSARYST